MMGNQVAIFKMGPQTKLAPHAGAANYRLYCHLGLIVPEGPWLRVGQGSARKPKEGKTICFDDSFVHEAGNTGDKDRYVLMFSWWHPDFK